MQSNLGPLASGVCVKALGGKGALFWVTCYRPLTRTSVASFSLKPPAKATLKDAIYLKMQTIHFNLRFNVLSQAHEGRPTSFKKFKYLGNRYVDLYNPCFRPSILTPRSITLPGVKTR